MSSLTIREEKRSSALEMSSLSLLLELFCMGLGAGMLQNGQLLQSPGCCCLGKRCHDRGDSNISFACFTRLQWVQRYFWSRPKEKQRPMKCDHLLCIFRSSYSLLLQNHRTAQVGRYLEKPSGPTFCGKESLLSSTLGLGHLEISTDEDSTASLGRLYQ